MTCNESSVTFEEMNQISVELPSINETKYVSLNDCLQHHFADLVSILLMHVYEFRLFRIFD